MRRILKCPKLQELKKKVLEVQKYYSEETWKQDGLPNFSFENVLSARRSYVSTFFNFFYSSKWYSDVLKKKPICKKHVSTRNTDV